MSVSQENDPRWRRTSYGKIRTTLYLDGALWQSFKAICTTEGQKMSFKIEKWIKKYVEDHSEGNPQQHVDRYNTLDAKPYIAPKGCAFCHSPATKLLKSRINNNLVPLCLNHFRWLEQSPNYEATPLTIGGV